MAVIHLPAPARTVALAIGYSRQGTAERSILQRNLLYGQVRQSGKNATNAFYQGRIGGCSHEFMRTRADLRLKIFTCRTISAYRKAAFSHTEEGYETKFGRQKPLLVGRSLS